MYAGQNGVRQIQVMIDGRRQVPQTHAISVCDPHGS
jgi:hypothetical protein